MDRVLSMAAAVSFDFLLYFGRFLARSVSHHPSSSSSSLEHELRCRLGKKTELQTCVKEINLKPVSNLSYRHALCSFYLFFLCNCSAPEITFRSATVARTTDYGGKGSGTETGGWSVEALRSKQNYPKNGGALSLSSYFSFCLSWVRP